MARRRKTRETTPSIAREDWDMALMCRLEHVHRCRVYEFARELLQQGNSLPVSSLAFLPDEFAEIMKNAEWVKNKSYLLTISLRPKLENATYSKPPQGVLEWLTRYSPKNPVRLCLDEPSEDVTRLVIDWDESNSKLSKSFEGLIKEIRPRLPINVRENRSEKYRADLRALGAFRLSKAGYTHSKAIDYTISVRDKASEKNDSEPLFKYSPEWTKAKKRAESVIKNWSDRSSI